jgi:hypothetical protein
LALDELAVNPPAAPLEKEWIKVTAAAQNQVRQRYADLHE